MLDKFGAPLITSVDDEEGREGENEKCGGGNVCGGIAEFLDLVVDRDGERSGDAGDVSADHQDDAELADGMGEGEDGGG